MATDHKTLASTVESNSYNKTSQSKLTRYVDRLLPYQFKRTHILRRDIRIVDYLYREPNGDMWPESE